MKRIVLTGGGTAGHVTPNLALIPRLQADGWDVHYIGAANSVEEGLVANLPGVTYHTVAVGKLRRYFDLKNFSDPFRVIKGVDQARRIIHRIRPDVVFSKGGFVSVPVVYGAWLNRVPVVIHESDMTPGLANKLSVPFAKAECCTFPEAVQYARGKGVYTGTPLRAEIFAGDPQRGRERFGLTGKQYVLASLGHGAVRRGNYEDSAVHLGRAGDHVLNIVGMAGAVNVRIVALVGLVLDVCGVDGYSTGLLFGRLVDFVVAHRGSVSLLAQRHGDGGGQGGLAMVYVTYGADVDMGLSAFKFCLCHLNLFLRIQ